MQEVTEFQVRAVERYVVTRFHSQTHDNGKVESCSNVWGEYPNAEIARQAKEAFESAEHAKARMSQFAVVQRGFDPATQVYYANTREEAESFAEQFTKLHGGEWRIYSAM